MRENELKLHQLQPEVFSAEPMWEDFLTDMAASVEDLIRDPIRQLERIRDVGPNSDPVILAETLRQLGITFPVDLIQHNLRRLRSSTHFLAHMKDKLGTDEAYPIISYVLGRYLEVTNLYTRNYRDFYGKNYESLNIDGGRWYKTTHVDLGMEAVAQDRYMPLSPGQTRKDRVLDAYFELAPVTQVIRRFYWIHNLICDLYISARIYVEKTKFITIGRGDWGIVDGKIDGPDVVESGSDHNYLFDIDFADRSGDGPEGGTITRQVPRLPIYGTAPAGINLAQELSILTEEATDTNNRILTVEIDSPNEYGYLCYPIELGTAEFTDTGTGIGGGWDGASWPDDGDIGNDFGPIVITRTIGETTSQWYLYRMDFPSIGIFNFDVVFQNPGILNYSTVIEVIPGGEDAIPGYTIPGYVDEWSASPANLAHIDNKGRVTFGNVNVDTPVTINVTAYGKTVSKTVILRAERKIDYLSILGPDNVRGGESHALRVFTNYNGVATEVDVPVTCIDPSVRIDYRNLVVYGTNETHEIELMATYKGHTALKRVNVIYVSPEVVLTGIRVTGPAYVYERDSITLNIVAEFSDNSERDVYPLLETSTPIIYVGGENKIWAGLVHDVTECYVTATYQLNGVTKVVDHFLEVLPRTHTMVSLTVRGPITVQANERYSYSAIAKWSNGTESIVLADWFCDKFNIDKENGIVEIGSIEDPQMFTVRAEAGGYHASLVANAFAEPIVVTSLSILGPDNISENSVGQFQALASYTDGKQVIIDPNWSVVNGGPHVSINSNGQLIFSGDVQTGIVEVEARYNISGKTIIQKKPVVLVPDVPSLLGLTISGPNTVEEYGRINLIANATYSDGRVEQVTPVWTVQSSDPINVPEAAADVFERGIVQGRRVDVETNAVIVARYFSAVASHVVKVTPFIERSPDIPVSSRLIGPPVLQAGGVASFAQAIVFEECAQELLVSSDWTIDVDPTVAAIDENGYLYSVNGMATPVTVTATYNCGTYVVTNSMVANIIASMEDISAIIINGPDAVIENSTTPYTVELFRVGQSPIPGNGELISENITWEILSGPSGAGVVVVDGIGSISVLTVPQDTQIILKAIYREGFSEVSATKVVAVNKSVPVFGKAPIGVRNDSGISGNLTQSLPTINSNQTFTLNVGIGQYGYFAYPASLGFARFIQADNAVEGGWDGAGWPDDGSAGESVGPLTVARLQNGVITNWYLYRTDFSSLGLRTWTVLFGN